MQVGLHIISTILTLAIMVGCFVLAQSPVPQTTTPKPATCVQSNKKPSPQVQTYHLKPCIVAKFAAYIMVSENSYVNLEPVAVPVSEKESQCGADDGSQDPKLVVNFKCGQIGFDISKNNNQIYVKSISGKFTPQGEPSSTDPTFSNSTKLFVSGPDHYYKCNSEQPVVVKGTSSSVPANTTYTLVLSNFAYEAYRTASGTDFYKIAEECELDSGPFSDGVRIGVGICLIAFVAIILIAYFVGRRRWSQRSSYESV